MVVPDGSLAGKQVIVLEPLDTFPFLRLPAELRSIIFDLIFPEKLVQTSFSGSKKRKSDDERTAYGSKSASETVNQREKVRSLTIKTRHPTTHGLDLLRVSKQLSHEAASVAYDKHIFEVTTVRQLSHLCHGLGSMLKYVRHLKLTASVLDADSRTVNSTEQGVAMSELLRVLQGATSLCTMTLSHASLCSGMQLDRYGKQAVDFENGMLSALEAIAASREVEAVEEVLNIVRTEELNCRSCQKGIPEYCPRSRITGVACTYKICGTDMDKHGKQLQTTFRNKLARLLGNMPRTVRNDKCSAPPVAATPLAKKRRMGDS